jgi:hypothetical protein
VKINTSILLLIILAIALVGCTTKTRPCVRIGATQAEIQKAIGNSKTDIDQTTDQNRDPNLRVSAGFEKGVCNKIKYVSVNKQKITDHGVSVILSLNSRGVAWIVREDSTPSKTTYLTIDGKYRAILTNKKELFIVTEKFWQKSLSELTAEKQKSQAPVPSQP